MLVLFCDLPGYFGPSFSALYEIREITQNWIRGFNEEPPRDCLRNLILWEYLANQPWLENSSLRCD